MGDIVQNTPSVTASTVIMVYQPGMCSDLSTTDWSPIWVGILQYFAPGSDMDSLVHTRVLARCMEEESTMDAWSWAGMA